MIGPKHTPRQPYRILVVGDFVYDFYEPSFCRALRSAGAEVRTVALRHFYGPLELAFKAETRFGTGPFVTAARAAVLARALSFRPHLLLAWRAPWLSPTTLRAARRAGVRAIALYTNDDPFGPDRDLPIWRRFRRLIPYADTCLAYRSTNISEFRAAGARSVGMLRSYFDPAIHRPLPVSPVDRRLLASDATFVGHYEPDGREEYLSALTQAGLHVRVFGRGWDTLRNGALSALGNSPPAVMLGDDYARAIAAAKIGLVFLSRRNRDQYTRRCFEIPAIGTMMLAPRTPELTTLFTEDKEAVFFGTVPECVDKARWYAANDTARQRIATAGRERCLRDGHDVYSRARQFLLEFTPLLASTAS